MKKLFKNIIVIILILVVGLVSFFFLYSNSLSGINKTTLMYYEQLKNELIEKKYEPNTLVISGKRAEWHNELLTSFGAVKKSQHLSGSAIDIMVLDVNNDGEANSIDVDIATKILEKLIGNKGGIGTYKTEKWIWNRQMIHFDSRGHKARWNR